MCPRLNGCLWVRRQKRSVEEVFLARSPFYRFPRFLPTLPTLLCAADAAMPFFSTFSGYKSSKIWKYKINVKVRMECQSWWLSLRWWTNKLTRRCTTSASLYNVYQPTRIIFGQHALRILDDLQREMFAYWKSMRWIGQVKGGWEAYYCDRSAVAAGIPDSHTSLVGDSPNAPHTYILYYLFDLSTTMFMAYIDLNVNSNN